MDHAERYFQLLLLGRDAFVKSVSAAAMVRRRATTDTAPLGPRQTVAIPILADFSSDGDTLVASLDGPAGAFGPAARSTQIYPLLKKPGAAFPHMITIGRTANNDVVVEDVTVSRFHAFVRELDGAWTVCDAGSKNGTRLRGRRLEPRKESPVTSGARVTVGSVEMGFYTAEDLFDVLSGTGSR